MRSIAINVWLEKETTIEPDEGGWISVQQDDTELTLFTHDGTVEDCRESIRALRKLQDACTDQIELLADRIVKLAGKR